VQNKNQSNYYGWPIKVLAEEWKNVSPNQHRVGESYAKANYGVIELSGKKLTMSIKDVSGNTVMSHTIEL
jgi:alkaline phosphatase D